MAIPDFQSVMRPVLQTVSDGYPRSLADVREAVKEAFELSEEERKERLPSGNQTVINNRVGWARTCVMQWTRAHQCCMVKTVSRVP